MDYTELEEYEKFIRNVLSLPKQDRALLYNSATTLKVRQDISNIQNKKGSEKNVK